MKEELLKELKEAMRNKDELRKDTITLLRAAILQIEKDEQRVLNESDMELIVSKEIKKRKEAINEYMKASRDDIVSNLNKEIEILTKYLPEQLSEDEIIKMIEEVIIRLNLNSIKDMGKVMLEIKNKIAGKADGKFVSEKVRELLNKRSV
ncbi:MAG: GatB/YqeY domain-containing protein [Clostridia bacterium]